MDSPLQLAGSAAILAQMKKKQAASAQAKAEPPAPPAPAPAAPALASGAEVSAPLLTDLRPLSQPPSRRSTLSATSLTRHLSACTPQLTGSAAILAKLRQQPAASMSASAAAASAAPATGLKLLILHGGEPAAEARAHTAAIRRETRPKNCSSPRLDNLCARERCKSPSHSHSLPPPRRPPAQHQIAERAASEARARGIAPTVLKMSDFAQAGFEKPPAKHALFIVETVENAQPAESAGPCVRFFNRRRKEGAAGSLSGLLSYAVLGLGDTNLLMDRQTTTAADCNQAAQTLDSALRYLGATPVCERGEANDAVGLEEAVAPWLAQLWAALAPPAPAAAAASNGTTPAANGGDKPRDYKASAAELLVLYGSQTGNSAEIAQNVTAEAQAKGVKVRRAEMDACKPEEVIKPGSVRRNMRYDGSVCVLVCLLRLRGSARGYRSTLACSRRPLRFTTSSKFGVALPQPPIIIQSSTNHHTIMFR